MYKTTTGLTNEQLAQALIKVSTLALVREGKRGKPYDLLGRISELHKIAEGYPVGKEALKDYYAKGILDKDWTKALNGCDKRYTVAQKKGACIMVNDLGLTKTSVCKQVGCTYDTLQKWLDNKF